jgi:hypothetical protein
MPKISLHWQKKNSRDGHEIGEAGIAIARFVYKSLVRLTTVGRSNETFSASSPYLMLSTKGAFMRPPSNLGRVAGIWYLLLIAIGPFFLIYVPGKLYVKGNAAATIANIAAHERLFRFGILAELIGGIILIFLVLAFYRLFRDVDSYLVMLSIILGGVMPAVIYFVNAAYELEVLMLALGADFFSVLDNPHRNALVMVFVRLHSFQIDASLLLAGAWLFPLAMLVYRSRFLPRFLGVWLGIGGIAWYPARTQRKDHHSRALSVAGPAWNVPLSTGHRD